MLYLIAFMLPPAVLLIAGKPVQATFNLMFFGLVWVAMFFFVFPPLLFWVAAATHAALGVSEKRLARQTSRVVGAVPAA